jgi:hypothetical protein
VALSKAQEVAQFVELHPVPSSMKCSIYFDLALSQASNGLIDEAAKARKLAAKFHGNHEAPAPYLGKQGYEEVWLLSQEGLVQAHAGKHGDAVDLYEQAWKAHASQPTSERARIELLNMQLLSLLKQEQRDKEQCKKLWLDAISSAQALQSEQRFNEAVHILDIMDVLWLKEKDMAELREITTHW